MARPTPSIRCATCWWTSQPHASFPSTRARPTTSAARPARRSLKPSRGSTWRPPRREEPPVSSEISDVLEAIETLSERGEKMALATVVAVRGSTYRRPGARLLVRGDGELIGNISGGCIDGDVQELAKEVMGGGKARLVDFDLTADDEAVWGWGLGCNGAMELFVEPAEKAFEVAHDLRRALEEEREVSVVTVIESSVEGVERGARLLVHPDRPREKTLGDADADEAATAAALAALGKGQSIKQDLSVGDGVITAFVEVLEPSPKLLICGAGLDAIPVVRFA